NQTHVHKGDECRRNQKFVSNGVKQCAEGGHLQPATREIAIGPVCRGGQQQHEYTPNLEMQQSTPQYNVETLRQQDHDQNRNEEDPEQRQSVGKVHKSSLVGTKPRLWASL